jgi:hypothetical protein
MEHEREHDSIQFDSPLPVVHAWQEAANQRDIERLMELSDPDIEIVGPRGSSRGREVLRDWVERAGVTLQTYRAFVGGETVVLAQHGAWQTGGERDIATRFRVDDGRVVQIERYDTLEEALQAAGLDSQDEMNEW